MATLKQHIEKTCDWDPFMKLQNPVRDNPKKIQPQVATDKGRTSDIVSELQARISMLESTLRQRAEEIDQTRRELLAAKEDSSKTELLQSKLRDADAWVFRLAGERQAAEKLLSKAERDMSAARAKIASKDTAVQNLKYTVNKLKEEAHLSNTCRRELEEQLEAMRFRFAEVQVEKAQANSHLLEAQLNIHTRFEELANLSGLHTQFMDLESDTLAQMAARDAEIQKLTKEREQAANDRKKVEGELTALRSELEAAKSLVQLRSRQLHETNSLLESTKNSEILKAGQQEWLVETYNALTRQPWWWAFMPQGWKKRQQHKSLERRRLFDAKRYLELHPDVVAEGMDPVHHYIMHGMLEGRVMHRGDD